MGTTLDEFVEVCENYSLQHKEDFSRSYVNLDSVPNQVKIKKLKGTFRYNISRVKQCRYDFQKKVLIITTTPCFCDKCREGNHSSVLFIAYVTKILGAFEFCRVFDRSETLKEVPEAKILATLETECDDSEDETEETADAETYETCHLNDHTVDLDVDSEAEEVFCEPIVESALNEPEDLATGNEDETTNQNLSLNTSHSLEISLPKLPKQNTVGKLLKKKLTVSLSENIKKVKEINFGQNIALPTQSCLQLSLSKKLDTFV